MTRAPLLLLAAGAIAVPFATGCGSSNSDNPDNASAAPATATTTTAAAAAAPAAAKPGTVNVALNEWKVVPSTTKAKAGKVTFDVKNTGKMPHEMVVIKTDKGAGDLGKGARISEKGSAGEAGDVPAGGSKSVTLNLKPGHYALVCNIAGHYAAGMHADFTVS